MATEILKNGSYTIEERTPEEIAQFMARHEGREPHPFMLSSNDINLSTHETREDAEEELLRWKARDLISEKVEDFRDEILEIARKHGLNEDDAIQTAKEAF